MSSNTLVITCVALGGLGAWNTWTLHQVSQRLDKVEQQKLERVSVNTSKRDLSGDMQPRADQTSTKLTKKKRRRAKSSFGQAVQNEEIQSSKKSIDLADPDVQEAIAEIAELNAQKKEEKRRKSKMEAYKASLQLELEKFSNEKEYDSETVKSIETILDESTAEWTAVRAQVREGEISWMDARTEFKAIGDETETKVTEFISTEDYQELRSRLWGDWGR